MNRPILRLNKPSRRANRTTAQVIEDDCRRPTGTELLAQLASHYPALFHPANPKPLAIGIHAAMRDDSGMSGAKIRRALYRWCNSREYLQAIAKGGPRWGVDGMPDGFIAKIEAANAREALAALDAETDDDVANLA